MIEITHRDERVSLSPLLHTSLLWLQDMKSAPLLLLLCSVLFSSHLRPADGRPRILPGWLDGNSRLQQRLDEMLQRAAGDSDASELLDDVILKFPLRRNPVPLRLLPPGDHDVEEEEEEALSTATQQLLKRSDDPPLSIDLTFHLLRNMIQMAKTENQREQAQFNRKVLDEVGK